MNRFHAQQGAALLSILLIVSALSVAAVLATSAIARQTDLSRAAAQRADAGWAAHSAEALARSAIAELMKASQGRIAAHAPGLNEPVAFVQRGGMIRITVRDGTNCFNLNAFASDDENAVLTARRNWALLLGDLGIPTVDADALADTLADWIDADSTPRARGAEDEYYLSRSPPYRAANAPLESPRELAAILGYSAELREALSPLVCALPTPAQPALNINTLAPREAILLRALYAPQLSLETAERMVRQRPTSGWLTVEDFEALPDLRTLQPGGRRTQAIGVRSHLFAASGEVSFQGNAWPFEFLIDASDGQAPRTIWRRLGEE